MSDDQLLRRYLDHLTEVCNYARNTVRAHRRISATWAAFLRTQRGHGIERASAEDLLAWIEHREVASVKGSTIAKELCVFRTLYGYLQRSALVFGNPAASLPEYICNPPAEKLVLSVEECFAMLRAFDTDSPLGLRNYLIVALLWSTGLRNSELCALNWGDIDLDEAVLVVRKGKGGKQRQIFLNDRVCGDLKRYRRELCPHDGPARPVFYALSVNAPDAEDFKRLSTHRVDDIVRLHARDVVGLDKPVNPLTFRHTFATHMLEAGVDIADIKEIMGHEQQTETCVYLHVTMEAAKRFLNDHLANPSKYQ